MRRLGIGYTGQVIGWPVPQAYSAPVSAVSLRWWSEGRIGLEADVGLAVSFGNGTSYALGVLAKLPIKLVRAENLSIYVAPGINVDAGGSTVGLGIGAAVGCEFFFAALPRLGFGAEVGVGVGLAIPTDGKGSTTGALGLGGAYDLLSVGVRYYFL